MKPNDIVFLSASLPFRPPWDDDAELGEIEQAIVSIARAVFARRGRLLFGGHPSISPLIADIAGEYYPIDRHPIVRPIVTVQSEFFKEKLPQKTWDLYTMGWSEIEWTPAGKDRAESLDIMRSAMLGAHQSPRRPAKLNDLPPPVLMFAVGGMEGVRDEAAMFLETNTSRFAYLLKTPGAATSRLAEPPQGWRERLWPVDEYNSAVFEALVDGKRSGRLVDLEKRWEEELRRRQVELRRFEVQPYGTMVQWTLDEVLYG